VPVYPVDEYLTMLKLANRSEVTIKSYRKVIKWYSDFIGVPIENVHNHLSISNLLKYAATLKDRSPEGRKTTLTTLHRYFKVNGVVFDELQYNAMKPKVSKEHNDKPLELETLRKMMNLTDSHGRAFLSFLISTGARASETCQILLSDVDEDRVTIRNETTAGAGGIVYLTSEAREYITQWLKERDGYIALSDRRSVGLATIGAIRPKHDNRLFGMSYASAHKLFSRLYDKVDGSRGKYHRECTIHSARKYFRTHAATAMHPDLVTGLMRQTGYMDSTYVRMTDEERYKQFKDGESALYIFRSPELDEVTRERDELKETLERRLALTEIHIKELMNKGI
jgi:integrase